MGTLKNFSTKQKKLLTYIVLEVLLVAIFAGIVLARFTGLADASGESSSYDAAEEASMEEYIRTIVGDMFVEYQVVTMAEADIDRLTATITTGVLNSLPQDMMTEEVKDEIRGMVDSAVNAAVEEKIETVVDSKLEANNEAVIEAMKAYIDSDIVPSMTALIQINAGAISDLKTSLSTLSTQYNDDKKRYDEVIDTIQKDLESLKGGKTGAIGEEVEKLKKDLSDLAVVLDEYKSINSAEVTTLAAELASLRSMILDMNTRLEDLTNNQLQAFKKSLQDQIDANAQLTATQRSELEAHLDASIADTHKSFKEISDELEKAIADTSASNTAALNTFIESIYGDASDDVTIGDLLSQIKTNADLTAEQKEILVEMIDTKYNAATSDAKAQVDAVRVSLEASIAASSASNADALNAFVASLYGDASGDITIADLLSQIEQTTDLTTEQKNSLVEMINTKYADATADTTAQVADVKTDLQAEIASASAANEQALRDFAATLYGDASGDITIADLLSQIKSNADLTAEQKDSLTEMVNEKSSQITAEFSAKVNDVQTALSKEVTDREKAIERMAASLTTSMETKVAELETKVQQLIDSQIKTLQNSLVAQIETNKNLSDEQKASLQQEINDLASKSATAEELAGAIADLTAKITQNATDNQTALTNAINDLLGEGATEDITIAELENRIAAADISEEQKQELLDAIATSYTDATADTALKVGEAKAALQEEIDRNTETLTNAVNSLQTELEKKIADLEIKVSGLIESQIKTLQNSLVAQIETNKNLSDEQKAALQEEINSLADSSATAVDLANAVTDLTARINQSTTDNQTALTDAINNLLGEGATADITIAELESRIAAADISEAQKQQLLDAISASYTNATDDTTVKVGEAKEAMQAEIDRQAALLTDAVNNLQTDLEKKLAELEIKVSVLVNSQIETLRNSLVAQIETNKNLSDEQKASLQAEINSLADNAATAQELSAAVTDLTAQITQSTADNQAALNDAINNLLGEGATADITIAELESRIAAADISDEQKQQLLDAISTSYTNATADTTVKVGEAKEAMQAEIDRQAALLTNAVNSLQTDLEKKLADLEIKVTKLIDSQIKTLETSLIAQIQSNKDLSDEQKKDLEKKITDLASTSATSDDLSQAVNNLMDEIAQNAADNQTALTNAINNLLGEGASENITIAELENRIAAADISPAQKQELLDAISAAYTDATADTTLKVGEVSAALQKEVTDRTTAITNAVGSLKTELESQISALSSEIAANKNAQDAINTNLTNKITAIEDSLSAGCQITYNEADGHFYITTADGTVSKKLDFAQ